MKNISEEREFLEFHNNFRKDVFRYLRPCIQIVFFGFENRAVVKVDTNLPEGAGYLAKTL